MASLTKELSFRELQDFTAVVYGVPDDQHYSVWDLLTHQQRFSMRSLKGIRKGDVPKTWFNLLISISWLANVCNRMHVDMGEELWKRFPGVCSYCGTAPCTCRTMRPQFRRSITPDASSKPIRVVDFQNMFRAIYPPEHRTLADAGVHLAEETGEVHEAVNRYTSQHLHSQLEDIALEIADLVSCMCAVANSLNKDLAEGLASLFTDGCHVCHHTPCTCSFEFIADFKS